MLVFHKLAQSASAVGSKELYLPSLLTFGLLLLFLHGRRVRFLSTRLARGVRHVNAEDVDRVMVGRCRDVPRVPAELQVVDLGFVSATAEHKWARWVLCVHFPDAD